MSTAPSAAMEPSPVSPDADSSGEVPRAAVIKTPKAPAPDLDLGKAVLNTLTLRAPLVGDQAPVHGISRAGTVTSFADHIVLGTDGFRVSLTYLPKLGGLRHPKFDEEEAEAPGGRKLYCLTVVTPEEVIIYNGIPSRENAAFLRAAVTAVAQRTHQAIEEERKAANLRNRSTSTLGSPPVHRWTANPESAAGWRREQADVIAQQGKIDAELPKE